MSFLSASMTFPPRGALFRNPAGMTNDAETLERLAHSLAGAGATFGLASISEAAKSLEHAVEALRAGEAPSDDELAPVADLLAALSSAVQQA